MIGMSSSDTPFLILALLRDIGDMVTVPDRSHQGVLNHLLVTKLLATGFVNDSSVIFNGRSVVDPTVKHYWGISQGPDLCLLPRAAGRRRSLPRPTSRDCVSSRSPHGGRASQAAFWEASSWQ